MVTPPYVSSLHRPSRARAIGRAVGFTLVELMMALGCFSILMAAALTLYVFSLRFISGLVQQLEFNRQAAVMDFMIREYI
jgi:prepilin-type N-terminal cleavage/methylation domain-containing protein